MSNNIQIRNNVLYLLSECPRYHRTQKVAHSHFQGSFSVSSALRYEFDLLRSYSRNNDEIYNDGIRIRSLLNLGTVQVGVIPVDQHHIGFSPQNTGYEQLEDQEQQFQIGGVRI
jgi:hypothetical protein